MPTMPGTHRPRGAEPRQQWRPGQGAEKRIRGRAGVELRRAYLERHPLCRMCEAKGRVTAAAEVDHVIPLSRGGANDESNYQGLCVDCHLEKTAKEKLEAKRRPFSVGLAERRMPTNLRPSAVPLTIVCGPPGSGKSTLVREQSKPGDLVIDLDAIMSAISGLPEHHTSTRYLDAALAERNRQLHALASERRPVRAWFIIASPDPAERRTWAERLGGELVVLATPLAECLRRIEADPARAGHRTRMGEAARAWWARQTRGGRGG